MVLPSGTRGIPETGESAARGAGSRGGGLQVRAVAGVAPPGCEGSGRQFPPGVGGGCPPQAPRGVGGLGAPKPRGGDAGDRPNLEMLWIGPH